MARVRGGNRRGGGAFLIDERGEHSCLMREGRGTFLFDERGEEGGIPRVYLASESEGRGYLATVGGGNI